MYSIPSEAIAIIGASGRFPGAENLEDFWNNIRNGRNCTAARGIESLRAQGVPESELKHSGYRTVMGRLDNIFSFDAELFHVSAHDAEIWDPQLRHLLECCHMAMEEAGYLPGEPRRTAVFAAASHSSYLPAEIIGAGTSRVTEALQLAIGNDRDYLATHIAHQLNLTGPAMTVQTACSSSLTAVHLACQSLFNGECDMALAGGVSITMPQYEGYMHREGLILSASGVCRPFDSEADGTVNGNGVAALLLKRLDEAVQDGDPIHAVILATAINNDGSLKAGYTAPSVIGEAEVISEAVSMAQVDVLDIGLVSTHGTATAIGDPIETEALKRVLGSGSGGRCTLAAVKANIGHLDAAAGIAGLLLAMMAIKMKELPPVASYRRPNPLLDLDNSPFVIRNKVAPWTSERRLALANSFGFGGTNVSVVLSNADEAAESPAKELRACGDRFILPLSARSPEGLRRLVLDWHSFLATCPDIAAACWTCARTRKYGSCRVVVCAESADRLRQALAELAKSMQQEPSLPEQRQFVNTVWTSTKSITGAVPDKIEKLVADFLAGHDPDWSKVLSGRKCHIPVTPFEHREYCHPLALRRQWLPINPPLAAQSAAMEMAERAQRHLDLDILQTREGFLEKLCTAGVAKTFAALGMKELRNPKQALDDMRIPAHFSQLVERLLNILVQRGYAVEEDGRYSLCRTVTEKEMDELQAPLLPLLPSLAAKEETVLRALEILPDLLLGNRNLREFLMADGDLGGARHIYADQPTAVYCNALIREHVRAWLNSLASGSAVRILEIGGGTGATTGHILPLLPPERTVYTFTDVSPVFLRQAEKQYAEYSFLNTKLFNMEKSPALQGIELGIQDIVIASNVLHASSDLVTAVKNAASLLRPGGMLLLYELIRANVAGEITTGLLLTQITDHRVRGIQPMADCRTWTHVLEACGFENIQILPPSPSPAAALSDRVISATLGRRAHTHLPLNCTYRTVWQERNIPDIPWSEYADTNIWLWADEKTAVPFLTIAQEKNLHIHCLPMDPDSTLLEEMLTSSDHCILLDARALACPTPSQEQDMHTLQKKLCKGQLNALSIFTAIRDKLAASQSRTVQIQWISLTHGAVCNQYLRSATCENDTLVSKQNVPPTQSVLWGMNRVVAMGHPELGIRQLDIADLSSANAKTVLALALAGGRASRPRQDGTVTHIESYAAHLEEQGAVYAASWFVPRLVRCTMDDFALRTSAKSDCGWQLITGGLGGLGLTLAEHLARKGATAIALLGRHEPDADRQRTIDNLIARYPATRFAVLKADVTEYAVLDAAVSTLETEAPVTAIYHCAVVKRIGNTDEGDLWPGFWQILAPKVLGAWNLHTLSLNHAMHLEHMVFFSSLVSVVPPYSLPHYVAANTYLDALAMWRQSQGLPGLSISWGAWLEAGTVADPSLSDHLRHGGLHGFSTNEALALLDAAMQRETPHLALMQVEWNQMLRQYGHQIPACLAGFTGQKDESPLVTAQTSMMPTVQSSTDGAAIQTPSGVSENILSVLLTAEEKDRPALLEAWLAGRFARLLQTDAEQLDKTTSLFDAGIDSLMFIEMTGDLEAALGLDLSPASLLQNFTIRDIARKLLTALTPALSVPSSRPVGKETDLAISSDNTEDTRPLFSSQTEQVNMDTEGLIFRAGAQPVPHMADFFRPDPDNMYSPFPLTEVQKAYWVGRRAEMSLGNIACHGYEEFDCPDLDIDRLELAWNRLIERHGALRTIIGEEGTQRMLRMHEDIQPFIIVRHDLRNLSPDQQQEQLDSIRNRLSHKVHNPAIWPLFDIEVSILSDSICRLHLLIDNIAMDGWSISILLPEWAALYHKPDKVLPPLHLTFRDYVLAFERYRSTADFEQAKKYWQKQDIARAPDLPLKKDPALITQPVFVRHAFHMEPQLWEELRKHCTRHGVTPSALLLTVYAEVMGLWSGNSRLTINAPVFTRLPIHPEINDIIGEFTSNLLVTCQTGDTACLLDKTRDVQNRLFEGLKYCQVSGIEVMRNMIQQGADTRDIRMPVVYTSTFGLSRNADNRYAASMHDFSDIGSEVYIISQTPQVWIDCHVHDRKGTLHIFWDTVEGIFPEGMIEEMFSACTRFVQELAADEEAWTRTQVLPDTAPVETTENTTFSTAQDSGQTDQILHAGFLRHVIEMPDAPAVIDGVQTLTFRELFTRALTLAEKITNIVSKQAAGQTSGCTDAAPAYIAVSCSRGWHQACAVLAVLLAGAAYIPIECSWPLLRRLSILTKADVKAVICDGEVSEDWGTVPCINISRVTCDNCARVDDYSIKQSALLLEQAEQSGIAAQPAYVIFTSGTTGTPKGVMMTHRAAMTTIAEINKRFGITASDRVLALSSLAFDLSVYDLFGIWSAGGAVVCVHEENLRSPETWCRLIDQHGVTVWNSVPMFWQMLLESDARPERAPRLALLSGDKIPANLPERSQQALTETKLVSLGGATEAGIWSIAHEMEATEPPAGWQSIPYGKALARQAVHVLHEDLRVCPVNVPGELYISGYALASGYLNDREKTAEHFIVHPVTGTRMYKTGDTGVRRSNGEIEFLGRTDFQIKRGGFRIEPGEIEAVLSRFPNVLQTAVVKNQMGQLIAFVTADDTVHVPSQTDMLTFLAEYLPDYMLPQAIRCLQHMPQTANGKIDRAELAERADQLSHTDHETTVDMRSTPSFPCYAPLPQLRLAAEPTESDVHKGIQNLSTAVSAILCEIWSTVLATTVHEEDNVFTLGADSLLAVRAQILLKKQYNYQLNVQTVFDHPQIRDMAQELVRAIDQNVERDIKFLRKDRHDRGQVLICLGDAISDTACFTTFARYWPLGPVTAISIEPQQNVTLEEYLDHLCSRILHISGDTPVHLTGYCAGGLLAWHLCLKLQKFGHQVGKCLFVDCVPLQEGISSDTHALQMIATDSIGHCPDYVLTRLRMICALLEKADYPILPASTDCAYILTEQVAAEERVIRFWQDRAPQLHVIKSSGRHADCLKKTALLCWLGDVLNWYEK